VGVEVSGALLDSGKIGAFRDLSVKVGCRERDHRGPCNRALARVKSVTSGPKCVREAGAVEPLNILSTIMLLYHCVMIRASYRALHVA